MHKLDKYIGRVVSLKRQVFDKLKNARPDRAYENCFVVAAVDRHLNQLICYGAGRRINTCATEVVFV